MTAKSSIPFSKLEALGNSYIVVDPKDKSDWSAKEIRLWCSEDWGIGSDGILWGPFYDSKIDPPRLRIFNSDGSEAEKSGNGLRIFAKFLWDRELVNNNPFPIFVESGTVEARVYKDGDIGIEMGKGELISDLKESLNLSLDGESLSLDMTRVSVGNPHCCVFGGFPSLDSIKKWGPLLERDSLFPRRTNVQFVHVLDKETIELKIWERGSGYTLASGSSSCAVAFAAFKRGLVGRKIKMLMPGGELFITIRDEDDSLGLRGDVEWVCDGKWLKGELPSEEEGDPSVEEDHEPSAEDSGATESEREGEEG